MAGFKNADERARLALWFNQSSGQKAIAHEKFLPFVIDSIPE